MCLCYGGDGCLAWCLAFVDCKSRSIVRGHLGEDNERKKS
jgi:hypothetical protein